MGKWCQILFCRSHGDYLCPGCQRWCCERHAGSHMCVECTLSAMQKQYDKNDGIETVEMD